MLLKGMSVQKKNEHIQYISQIHAQVLESTASAEKIPVYLPETQ